MITQSQKEMFQSRGLLRLEGFLPAEKVNRARDVLLKTLEKRGIWQDGGWYLDELPPSTSPNAGARLLKGGITKSRALGNLTTAELLDAVAELLDGRPAFPMMEVPQVLFTLPNAETWTLPHLLWHLDLPRFAEGGIPGVQMFSFLDKVAPGGGGTLVVTGSHRLLNDGKRIRSQQVKRRLRRAPYFHELMSEQDGDRARFLREPV
jgi:hypothetical protein